MVEPTVVYVLREGRGEGQGWHRSGVIVGPCVVRVASRSILDARPLLPRAGSKGCPSMVQHPLCSGGAWKGGDFLNNSITAHIDASYAYIGSNATYDQYRVKARDAIHLAQGSSSVRLCSVFSLLGVPAAHAALHL